MRTYSASGRSRWPWIIGTAILILGIVVAIAIGATTRQGLTPTDTPSATGTAPSPTSSATPEPTGTGNAEDPGTAPTGCLGGTSRDTAMVLAAQQTAPHTMYGAVEVATAFTRWAFQFPYPSSDDADTVSQSLIASDAPATVRDLSGGYARAEDITNGNVPAGTPFYFSTVNGLWLARADAGNQDQLVVSVNGTYVIDGSLSPTKTAAVAWVLVWEDNRWRIQTAQQPDTAAIAAGGTTFTSGC